MKDPWQGSKDRSLWEAHSQYMIGQRRQGIFIGKSYLCSFIFCLSLLDSSFGFYYLVSCKSKAGICPRGSIVNKEHNHASLKYLCETSYEVKGNEIDIIGLIQFATYYSIVNL